MPSNTGRSAIRLASLIFLALLVGGCGGDSGSPTAAPATTAAPTTTTVPPLDAKERAWLKGLSGVRAKVDKSFKATGSGPVTRAIMVESSRQLAGWSRQLRRLGSPSDRLKPAYTLVRKAIRTYDKGAKCYATAARSVSASGAVVAGTPEEPIVEKALECAGAAQGNGAHLVYQADAEGDALKVRYS
jgi:hypothetical protein